PEAGPDGLTAGLRRYLAGIQPAGSVFAELTGGYDTTNLNLHPQVTPYELVCPGDVSSRPAGEQIPVSDLIIVDDEESGRPALRPARQDGMTDSERFLSWRRWRREHGLPERVFVSSAEPSGEDRQRAGDVEGAPLTKPQHIDFGSYFSLTLLDSVLRSAAD